MEFRFVHFYPDLMNLYGSWGNLAVLKRHLEDLGGAVTVETVLPGQRADLSGADFLFMGAGTERSQAAALADLYRYAGALRELAQDGAVFLFCGAAMQTLGRYVTDSAGKTVKGLDIAPFTSVQGKKRFVGDVYGFTPLYSAPIVGFMNSCARISGVDAPLMTHLAMGFGNDQEGGAEGYHKNGVFASELTGPILVKNPLLLRAVMAALYAYQEAELPAELPAYPDEERAFETTVRELKKRFEKPEETK